MPSGGQEYEHPLSSGTTAARGGNHRTIRQIPKYGNHRRLHQKDVQPAGNA